MAAGWRSINLIGPYSMVSLTVAAVVGQPASTFEATKRGEVYETSCRGEVYEATSRGEVWEPKR